MLDIQKHFPFLLGRLPGLLASLPCYLVTFVRRFLIELLLAAPFVWLLVASAVFTWESGFLFVLAIAIALLPVSYFVLVLMVQQRRQRRKPTKGLSAVRDDEV